MRTGTNPLSLLSRWKIFDNLRRSLVPVAFTALFVLGWTVLPTGWPWTLSTIVVLLLPGFLMTAADLFRKPPEDRWGLHVRISVQSLSRRLVQDVFSIACLPYDSWISLDAIVRAIVRMIVTRRRLLEWNPSGTDRGVATRISSVYCSMWIGPALAIGLAAYWGIARPPLVPEAAPVLALWLLSPLWTWWWSQPLPAKSPGLSQDQVAFLGKLSRKTWAFFETFVDAKDHWLPPDNFQEEPSPVVHHRTSPTNIGLALLANLSAYDFGYIATGALLERTTGTFRTMGKLERHLGHFYNWYDTLSLRPLPPLYVSTVDSGNLAGHLLTLRRGLLELPDRPLLEPRFFAGLRETFHVLSDVAGPSRYALLSPLRAAIEDAARRPPSTLHEAIACLDRLVPMSADLAETLDIIRVPETNGWAHALARQCRETLDDLQRFAPPTPSASMPTLRELAAGGDSESQKCAAQRMESIRVLAAEAGEFAKMDQTFLYDKTRRLFAIGYDVSERRQDGSFYDLLASEVRLAIFIAIAQGQAPQESWFALGRRLANVGGQSVLISWSGSMFEYLMPLLVMPTYDNSLLDQTYRAAVDAQIEYGERRKIPWGISESGYNVVDVHHNYQYRAFGVPGLGFKRGLADDLVIAPYASALALMTRPEQACLNLQRLAAAEAAGRYGLYEALDYTSARTPRGQSNGLVKSFMAHHQGMSLLAFAYVLLDRPMQRRFESDPELQAALLLLQERIPRTTEFHSHVEEAAEPRRVSAPSGTPLRMITTTGTPTPEVQLLSNGSYHVMLTSAGGGYSRWKDMAITRWREDATRDNWGTFCYIRDMESGSVWSTAFQPTLHEPDSYEATLTESRVEYRRRDDGIETQTEIAVSPEDDIELRRVRITNTSQRRRTLEITSFAEVVLSVFAADALHPAFGNLFVQTEILRDRGAIVCTRRPRSSAEKSPEMFHLMVCGDGNADYSYETDRAQFIGRGRTAANPQGLNVALSGSEGSVLDPIVAIRRRIILEPDETVSINIVFGVGETRNACTELIDKYQDPHFADRTFDLAWTHSQVVLRQINATESDAHLYGRLAGAVIYANPAARAPEAVLLQNRRSQSGLWGYSISGDLPIVLLRIADSTQVDMVRQFVQAHAYWKLKGLAVDLVIWNEDHAGYRQPLQDQIMSLIAVGVEKGANDSPGRIMVKLADQISEEDRILLQATARIVIADGEGSLVEQLGRWLLPKPTPNGSAPRPRGPRSNIQPIPSDVPDSSPLIFANGLGGFTADGREYIISIRGNRMTPAPWVNVIANETFGTIVSERGSANTWSENAHEFRLTPWQNDAVSDSGGEAFYIRDENSGAVGENGETGRFWSPTAMPFSGEIAIEAPYLTRHGFGYSVFEHEENGIRSELWTYVAVDAPVKFIVIRLRNNSSRPRRLSVTGYVEWVLRNMRHNSALYVTTEADDRTVFARNPFSAEFGDRVAFFGADAMACTITGDRTEFLGRNGGMWNPSAMNRPQLSGRVGAGLDPCAAIRVPLDLAAEQEREIVFTLGAAHNIGEARGLVKRFCGSTAARAALKSVHAYWNRTLGTIHVETPDLSLNVLANGWLIYQTLSCRFRARSGFYQPGGAIGFRDQLQDAMALVYAEPTLVRNHLLVCAGRQFVEGDVQHWWHPPAGRGVRTHCSDDYLWLPWAVCRYIAATGDAGILDETAGFLEGRRVKPEEDSYYDLPSLSPEPAASLYEHCVRAVNWGLRFGERGLPLIGSGDWNDGMNLIGSQEKGESVWLGFFLYDVLLRFAKIADMRQDTTFAFRCRSEASKLQTNIESNGWDGAWYRRAYFDDGTPLGSATNTECRIDSIPQSWSVLSGAGNQERSRAAMNALDAGLVRRDKGIVQLLDPPFDTSSLEPGYIKGYVPGVRENGGQYTQAAVWAAMAFAALKDARAWELFSMINPIHRGGSPPAIATYKVEPYVLAADVYAARPHTGRGGWSWYTGSAGWMYRLIVESLLGVRLEEDRLYVNPVLPADWTGFTMHYRFRDTVYHIQVRRESVHDGPPIVTLDGSVQNGDYIPLTDDRAEHNADVVV